jgi:hypothetical protein
MDYQQTVVAVAAGVAAQPEHLGADAFPVHARGLGGAVGADRCTPMSPQVGR